jgi:uncharacterized protein YbjT (DUF2867 family)
MKARAKKALTNKGFTDLKAPVQSQHQKTILHPHLSKHRNHRNHMSTILVTGASGTIGRATVNALLKCSGVTIRAGVRTAIKAEVLEKRGAVPVDLEWGNTDKLAAAVKGVDKIFLLTPLTSNQVEIGKQLIDAAKAAKVSHIVKLSAIGCELESGIQLGRWHRAIEKHLEASGIAYTFLRPNNFFENFLYYYPPAADGVISLPFGDGMVSWIDGADLGEAAAITLTQEGHLNKSYTLTGAEALGIAEITEILAEVSGNKIRYIDVPESTARDGMRRSGAPEWMIDAMLELHAINKAGYASAISGDLKSLLGRPPKTFKEFAWANAEKFKR